MLRVGLITDELSMDFDYVIKVMKENNYKEAEIRGIWGKNIADMSIDEVKKAREMMDKNGISACAVCSPFYKCTQPGMKAEGAAGPAHGAKEKTFEDQIDLLYDLIAKSRILGTNIIRSFAFWKKGPFTDEVFNLIVESYRKPLEIAKKENIILALENEPACYGGRGKDISRILKALNHPNLKTVWDPGNAYVAGEDPFPGGYEAVKDYIVHVHIKDPIQSERDVTSGERKFKFNEVGKGIMDFKAQFRALSKHYDGVLSLETHYVLEGDTTGKGTIECMKSLTRIVSEIK